MMRMKRCRWSAATSSNINNARYLDVSQLTYRKPSDNDHLVEIVAVFASPEPIFPERTRRRRCTQNRKTKKHPEKLR
jgi:hypothetical protein